MIVRIEVHHHTTPHTYWQLKRCHVQVDGPMQDVCDPALLRPIRFDTLEEGIRHAKKVTFTFLETRRHAAMPDEIEWRVHEDNKVFPCPACHQPLYRKAKLGRFGNTLDLQDWGCVRCKKTVTLNTEGLLTTASVHAGSSSPPLPSSQERVIQLPQTASSTVRVDASVPAVISPVEMVISSSPFAKNGGSNESAAAEYLTLLVYFRAFRSAG
jgi:hypothetical protein